jgi:hypothetical protein
MQWSNEQVAAACSFISGQLVSTPPADPALSGAPFK